MTPNRDIATSARWRLVVGYLLVGVVVAAAWLWWLYGPLARSVISQQERDLVGVARSAAIAVTSSHEPLSAIAARAVVGTDLRLTIVRADGFVLADTSENPSHMGNHASRPEIRAALQGRVGTARRRSATLHQDMVYVAVPAQYRGERIAMRASEPTDAILRLAGASQRLGLLLLLGAIAVSGAAASWAAAATVAPVRRLSRAAEAMAAGDLSTALPRVPPDLADLASALDDLRNQIRARIDDLESEQRTLRTGLDGVPDAVFLLEEGRIRFANSAASRLFTRPPGGWRGRTLTGAGLPASLVAAVQDRLREGSSDPAEFGPDPTGRYFRLVTTALTPIERGERDLVVIADMTERMRLDRIRRDFVANASHELKTPVAGIQLLSESAETAAEDGDIDQALSFTRQISQESTRLKRLVTDLLELSRLEATLSPGSIADVRKAALNAAVAHGAAAQRKGLELTVDDESVRGEDVFAACDPTDLAVALDNLVDNAIAYTEQGAVTVSLSAADQEVKVAVADTGIGIPSSDLSRIFERFYRVDRGRSRESGGTGLGLSLVKHVVERSGGQVIVTSEPEVGSTFTITLPRAR